MKLFEQYPASEQKSMASMKADILLDFPDDGRTRKSPRLLDLKYLLVEKPSLDSFRHHTAVTLRPDIQEQIGRRSQVKLVSPFFRSSPNHPVKRSRRKSLVGAWPAPGNPALALTLGLEIFTSLKFLHHLQFDF